MTIEEFADLILRAQALRENSWNGSVYTKTPYDCARHVMSKSEDNLEWTSIITWLNMRVLNDVEEWAEKVLNPQLPSTKELTDARRSK